MAQARQNCALNIREADRLLPRSRSGSLAMLAAMRRASSRGCRPDFFEAQEGRDEVPPQPVATQTYRCRRQLCWNSVTRSPALESTGSGSEVNRLIDGLCCQGVPAIDLAHVDLTGGEQRPEQHRRRICRWQHGLRFDPPLELFV